MLLMAAVIAMATPTDIMIYFERGGTALSERGRRTLDLVVYDATGIPPNRDYPRRSAGLWPSTPNAIVEGNADRSGSASHNLALSRRRAIAVRDYLVSRGYRLRFIEIESHGETQPAIATGDGIPEADNRRVHVRFEYERQP